MSFLEGTPLYFASIFIKGFRLPLLFIASIVIVSRASIKPYGFGQVLLAVLPYIVAFLLTMALAFVIEYIAVVSVDIQVFLMLSSTPLLYLTAWGCLHGGCWLLLQHGVFQLRPGIILQKTQNPGIHESSARCMQGGKFRRF